MLFQFLFRRLFFQILGIDVGICQEAFISRWIGKTGSIYQPMDW